jgi:hypothetical protein
MFFLSAKKRRRNITKLPWKNSKGQFEEALDDGHDVRP